MLLAVRFKALSSENGPLRVGASGALKVRIIGQRTENPRVGVRSEHAVGGLHALVGP